MINETVGYPIGSDFFAPSITITDYYRLKEKFEDLEWQIEEVEKIIAKNQQSTGYKNTQELEFQLNRIEDNLEIVRSLVREYCKKFSIETNFTFRLENCEKRANGIVQELIQLDIL